VNVDGGTLPVQLHCCIRSSALCTCSMVLHCCIVIAVALHCLHTIRFSAMEATTR
jgi:hypothetical protein